MRTVWLLSSGIAQLLLSERTHAAEILGLDAGDVQMVKVPVKPGESEVFVLVPRSREASPGARENNGVFVVKERQGGVKVDFVPSEVVPDVMKPGLESRLHDIGFDKHGNVKTETVALKEVNASPKNYWQSLDEKVPASNANQVSDQPKKTEAERPNPQHLQPKTNFAQLPSPVPKSKPEGPISGKDTSDTSSAVNSQTANNGTQLPGKAAHKASAHAENSGTKGTPAPAASSNSSMPTTQSTATPGSRKKLESGEKNLATNSTTTTKASIATSGRSALLLVFVSAVLLL